LEAVRKKIKCFLELGTCVGILMNPDDRTVEAYGVGKAVIVLRDGDILTLPDLLPGWEVAIAELWSPVFDEEEAQIFPRY